MLLAQNDNYEGGLLTFPTFLPFPLTLRRGQSLVVWAIREGRDAAAAMDK